MADAPFRVARIDEIPAWDRFVQQHPQGAIFHTAAMVRVFAQAKHHHPLAIAALDSTGEIAALLVAVRIQTLPGPLGMFASRSIFFAQPLCRDDDEGIAALALLLRTHDRLMRHKVLFAEVRPLMAAGGEQAALEKSGYEKQDYLNYVVDLTRGTDELFANLSRSCRQNIRRTEKRGVTICYRDDLAAIDTMYALIEQSYAGSQVPLADKSLFEAALKILPAEQVQVSLAYLDDKPVAGGICLVFKGRVFAWYGGTERISGCAPFALLTWDEILSGAANGEQLYDFGGAGWPDEPYGPREFKARFGGGLVNFGRYTKVYSPRTLGIAKRAYQFTRGLLAPKAAADNKAQNPQGGS